MAALHLCSGVRKIYTIASFHFGLTWHLGYNFTSAQITWRLPGLEMIEVKADLGSNASVGGPSSSRVVSIQSR